MVPDAMHFHNRCGARDQKISIPNSDHHSSLTFATIADGGFMLAGGVLRDPAALVAA